MQLFSAGRKKIGFFAFFLFGKKLFINDIIIGGREVVSR